MNFNDFTRAKSNDELLLSELTKQLGNMDISLPDRKALIRRIEVLQQELHRARILSAASKTSTKGVSMKTNNNNNVITFKTKEISARLRFQEILIKEGYSYEECAEMSLVELRNTVDEIHPMTIVSTSLTLSGGSTKKVIVRNTKSKVA